MHCAAVPRGPKKNITLTQVDPGIPVHEETLLLQRRWHFTPAYSLLEVDWLAITSKHRLLVSFSIPLLIWVGNCFNFHLSMCGHVLWPMCASLFNNIHVVRMLKGSRGVHGLYEPHEVIHSLPVSSCKMLWSFLYIHTHTHMQACIHTHPCTHTHSQIMVA